MIHYFSSFVKKELRKINIKNKIILNLLRVIAVLLLIVTVVLGAIAIIFSNSYEAPSIFGSNVYIVNTDAFSIINEGTAMITSKVEGDEILPGNLVIFRPVDSNIKAEIAEIQSANLADGVYSYYAKDKLGNELFLVYSQIIGKGVSYSDFLGGLISFLSSPMGVLAIAIIPCMVLVGFEFFKLAKKSEPEPEVQAIRKQDEVPTFIPSTKNAVNNYRRNMEKQDTPLFTPPKKTAKREDLTSAEKLSRVIAETQAEQKKNVAAAKPQATAKVAAVPPVFKAEDEETQLRIERERAFKETLETRKHKSREDAENIAAPNMKHASGSTLELEIDKTVQEQEKVVEYIPKKSKSVARADESTVSARARQPQRQPYRQQKSRVNAIPSLDKLLEEERSSEKKFSIDEILASIEKKA